MWQTSVRSRLSREWRRFSPQVVYNVDVLPVSAGHGAPAACHAFTLAANSSWGIGIAFLPSPGFQPHMTNLSSVRCSTS